MTECIPIEEMGVVATLPVDDPRRKHAAACPRCSTLLFAYDAFVRADDVADADPHAAELRLEQFIAANVVAASEAARVSGGPRPERGRHVGFFAWRNVLVAAAVVIGAVALLRWQPWVEPETVYRGEASAQFSGLVAVAGNDGTIELRWDPVSGADSYRVAILAQDLTEITRVGATEAVLRFDPRALNPEPWFWQVTALLEGGEILTSDPVRIAPAN